MTFQFESWQAFWHMGGYGFYVWLSFSVSALAVAVLAVNTIWTKRQLIAAVQAQIARKQRIQQSRKQENNKTSPVQDQQVDQDEGNKL